MSSPRKQPDDDTLKDYNKEQEEAVEENPVIEKDDVIRVKTVTNLDQFHRTILKNFYAVQEAEKTEILVPLFANEDGSVDIAVVDVTEEDLHNLSEAWDERVNGN